MKLSQEEAIEVAIALRQQLGLSVIYVVSIFGALLGLALVVLMCRAVYKCKALNANVRLLLGNLLLCATATFVGNGIREGTHLIRWFRYLLGERDKMLLIEQGTCRILTLIPATGSVSNMFALCILAIERTYASVAYKTYETVTRPILAIVLCLIQWSITLSLMVVVTGMMYGDLNGTRLPDCQIYVLYDAEMELSSMTKYWLRRIITLTTGVGSALPFLIIWWLNARRRRLLVASAKLSTRFQLKENVNMSIALAKLVLIRTAWDIAYQLWSYSILARTISKGDHPTNYMSEYQLSIIWWCMGSIVQTALMAGKTTTISQYMPLWFKRLTCSSANILVVNQTATELQQAAYLKDLHKMWEIEYAKQNEHAPKNVQRSTRKISPAPQQMELEEV